MGIEDEREFPIIPMDVANRLLEVVDYVDTHCNGEEGLYRREGQVSERSDLINYVKTGPLPDLNLYDIHSVAAVIKYVRRYRYGCRRKHSGMIDIEGALLSDDTVQQLRQSGATVAGP